MNGSSPLKGHGQVVGVSLNDQIHFVESLYQSENVALCCSSSLGVFILHSADRLY
jgi:hypothetical protein